jgi:hypothetical protein
MRKAIAAAALAAVSVSTPACSNDRADNGGATVSRNYSVGGFRQIEVAGPYDVDVRTGANQMVSAQGSEKLLERTVVEVKGDRLIIRTQNRKGWFRMGWSSSGKARFVVTVPQLNAATIAGSGDIRVDKVGGSSFEGTIAGSGALGIGMIDVQMLKLSIAGSGDAKASAGKAQNAEYEIAGSGGVEAGGIAAQSLKVSIAGSGSVRANAARTADVDIVGSGDVIVTGGAKCNVSKAGSGDVRCS